MRENLNQSYIRLSHGDSIYSKPKRLVVKLHFYILYSARLAIPISKINFEISTFSNFLRDVQLKWFHFKHRSHTTESVLMTIFSDEPTKPFWTFFLVLKFQTFCPCKIFKIFPDSIKIYIFFISYQVWFAIENRCQLFLCY